jgi:predicted nucleotidyltransferase
MMGGGGASYFPSEPRRLRTLIKQSQEGTERKRLDSDVNAYLQQLLMTMTNRDAQKIEEYLDEIAEILGDDHEIDRFLLGGSVAKHTYVDGLSDIDALVVLPSKNLETKRPQEVLNAFAESLSGEMTKDKVTTLTQGKLAITLGFTDGNEIQLLPAIRHRAELYISNARGSDWKPINPKMFQRELTKANRKLNNALGPTIKLVKSILSDLPEDVRPTGYHVESLSLEVSKGYKGPKTVKSLLLHILAASASHVLQPITDVTSQSRNVDEYLGRKDSDQRIKLSHVIAGISRRLNAAATVDRWKEVIEE